MAGKSLNIDLSDIKAVETPLSAEEKSHRELAKQEAGGRLNPAEAELLFKLRSRKQLNFTLPEFVRDIFHEQAKAAGKTPLHYFYQMLRDHGADIPADEKMDRRRY